MVFILNEGQRAASALLASPAMHILGRGGSRSGKTLFFLRAQAIRAMRAERSRHLSVRFRLAHIKQSIIEDTFPKMMRLCFPDVRYQLNKTDGFARFPNLAEMWFGGLDDKDRVEKVLGNEYATLFLNEVSQIPYGPVEVLHTRLAQKTGLPLRCYYDCNPPKKGHWSYKLFFLKQDPISKNPVAEPQNYVQFLLNPDDNKDNLAPETLSILRNLSGARRKRFYLGEYAEDNPDQLFTDETFDKHRILDGTLPQFQRIVVGVDPSGAGETEETQGDPIGIIVGALGVDGRAYILEDLTILAPPKVWGGVAVGALDRHGADLIVGEINYGGAMVNFVVKAAGSDPDRKKKLAPAFKAVTATRGKVVRAEPISYLVEDGKVRHVGYFPELEEELTGFTKGGYTGTASPNRADAYVWVLTELFPGLTEAKTSEENVPLPPALLGVPGVGGWLAG